MSIERLREVFDKWDDRRDHIMDELYMGQDPNPAYVSGLEGEAECLLNCMEDLAEIYPQLLEDNQ